MAKQYPARTENLRLALAREAARLMAEHGISDYGTAKRKAAARFGVVEGSVLPKNTEIEAALGEYQRLFRGESHLEMLYAQRMAALEAMRCLAEFEPRLVGPVLNGTATEHTDIQLHLFTDTPESVTLKLMDQGIPHEVTERRVRMNAERVLSYPGVRFELSELPVDATVFPIDGIRQAPVSPVDGKPMKRATLDELAELIESEARER